MLRCKAPRIPDALFGPPAGRCRSQGCVRRLRPSRRSERALAERALNVELDHHLASDEAGNTRYGYGYGRKAVTTETGRIKLEIPCDRQATFDPQLIANY